jgi:Ca2+-binding EF-hand superfamily protein
VDRSLAIGLASFALTASLLAIPAIANHHDADQGEAVQAVRHHGGGPMTRAQMESRLADRFAAADTDGNGTIDRSEAEARHAARRADRQARIFARLDTDGDGEISIAERDAARASRTERRRLRRSDMIVENRNMRGRVTPEMQAQLESGAEQAAPAEARPADRFARRNAAWAAADADGNGALNRTEFGSLASARQARRAAHGTNLFERTDSDNDGVLSLAEMSAWPLAMFERADTDNDDVVTRAERRAARRAMREQRRARR